MNRHNYAEVRDIFVKELKRDLIGPDYEEMDILTEPPSMAYLTGILSPIEAELEMNDQEDLAEPHLPFTIKTEEVNMDTNEESDSDKLNINKSSYKKQNSMGLRVYVNKDLKAFQVKIRWGEYSKNKQTDKKSCKEYSIWNRKVIEHEIMVSLDKDSFYYPLPKKGVLDDIYISVGKTTIKGTNNCILSVFLVNDNNGKSSEKSMYQVSMEISDPDEKPIFMAENIARKDSSDFQEFLYRNKPIFSKGYGCAAEWEAENLHFAYLIKTSFIPTHQIEGMSTDLAADNKYGELPEGYFSIREMAFNKKRETLIDKLYNLTNRYNNWINELPYDLADDKNSAEQVIKNCEDSLDRILEGIKIIEQDPRAYQAFIFMNEVMHTQISMRNYSKDNQITTLEQELSKENFSWHPFQLAFILLNIKGIVDPTSKDRKIVDLLWFPTGGGKTEAYIGIIAFLLGYRRLTRHEIKDYNKDGGVTVVLRYTLRLLTTQQRDRLTRLIVAAEYIRTKDTLSYGESEFSIGFWVGSQITANNLDNLTRTRYRRDWEVKNEYNKIKNQVIECPCCGEENLIFNFLPNDALDTKKTGVQIYCTNSDCYYYREYLPVYLIDEEIYRKTPTIIISTVDKFARLPWEEKTANLFGKVDRYCERCGYIADGEKHASRHINPTAKVDNVNPFFPPELIIQDELHLITGPLGTIYGLYETAIEQLSTITIKGEKYLPKYVAATATIRNAEEQIQSVFGRKKISQFPPPGLSIEDSFFGREKDLSEFPFRLYSGICISGQSVKTVVLRVYSVILQVSEIILHDPKYQKYIKFIDPYRTLIGYFNSIRELGGAVRLLDDDIGKRIQTIQHKYDYPKRRYIDKREELTSRIPSDRIPKILELLEREIGNDELDVALATNMISVGMDVDRLGLMVVNGQPKQTSEYIQASSRVGRSKPGLVVTIYNPYRPRDLSHYENFVGYHSRLYNYVEGTTATPFASRARDRALHAAIVAMLRLNNRELMNQSDAININNIDITEVRDTIQTRVSISGPRNMDDTINDFDYFIDTWRNISGAENTLKYYFYPSLSNFKKGETRLLSRFNDRTPKIVDEWDTLDSMRQIESASKVYLYEGWFEIEK